MAPRKSNAVPAFALLLVALAIALDGGLPSVGGGLGGTARALVTTQITAGDRVAQATSAAAIYGEAAARLADRTFGSAIEAQQHVLDRVQRELVPRSAGWSAVNAEVAAAVRAKLGNTPEPAALQAAYTEIAAGLRGVK